MSCIYLIELQHDGRTTGFYNNLPQTACVCENKVKMDSERECRSNEPWVEVKSRVKAHLLQSHNSNANEA